MFPLPIGETNHLLQNNITKNISIQQWLVADFILKERSSLYHK